MKEHDHFIAMHYHYDILINESKREEYITENHENIEDRSYHLFNYCPECGVKLCN